MTYISLSMSKVLYHCAPRVEPTAWIGPGCGNPPTVTLRTPPMWCISSKNRAQVDAQSVSVSWLLLVPALFDI